MATLNDIIDKIPADFLDQTSETGTIGNIYVNLGYLYSLSVSDELANQDKKEKKDISLYDFVKSMMNGINTSIGNVSNFDLFADPIDSKVRIIDINYVDKKEKSEIRDKVNDSIIEVHNLRSTVRSYKLESQIFNDQSTTLAIGAQAKGGALSSDSNTLNSFNKGLRDRIIPEKISPPSPSPTSPDDELNSIKTNLDILSTYVTEVEADWWESVGDFDVDNASKYANALKDLINQYKSSVKDRNKNRGIIPTKLTLEMDGIGGLIIGGLFKINDDIIPKGYKGEGGVGADMAYVVTELGHSIESNDWVTKIGAQYIVLDEPDGSSNWSNAKKRAVNTQAIKIPKPPVNYTNNPNGTYSSNPPPDVPTYTPTTTANKLTDAEVNQLIALPTLIAYLTHQQGDGGLPAILRFSYKEPRNQVPYNCAYGCNINFNMFGRELGYTNTPNIGKDYYTLLNLPDPKYPPTKSSKDKNAVLADENQSIHTPANFLRYQLLKWNQNLKNHLNSTRKYDKWIIDAMNNNKIQSIIPGADLNFIRTIIQTESSFNPKNITGSYKGLFQLDWAEFRKTYPNSGGDDIFDPEKNIIAGMKVMVRRLQTAQEYINKWLK